MPKEARRIAEFVYAGEDFSDASLVETGDHVWLSRHQRCTRHTYSGVPARRGTAIIDDGFYNEVPPDGTQEWVRVVRISDKEGRFDGSRRTELALRWLPKKQAAGLRTGTLVVEGADESVVVRVVAEGEVLYEHCMARLRRDIHNYEDCGRILLWHWHRYYRFLGREDAESLAEEFRLSCGQSTPADLADANRRASRMLYEAARDRGWRKLTRREQDRHGLSGQWHRAEAVLASGTGEHTRRKASHSSPYGRTAMREVARREAARTDESASRLTDEQLAAWWSERGRDDYAESLN